MAECTLKQWLDDWRAIAALAEQRPSEYLSITMKHIDTNYEVLLLSVFDPEIDEDESLLATSSRELTNNVGLYSRRTRDTGVGRIITNKGTPKFVLEQGSEALAWGAAIEGVTLDRWMKAARQSHTWRDVERTIKRDQLRERLNRLRQLAINRRLSELDEEKNSLEGLRIAMNRKVPSQGRSE